MAFIFMVCTKSLVGLVVQLTAEEYSLTYSRQPCVVSCIMDSLT